MACDSPSISDVGFVAIVVVRSLVLTCFWSKENCGFVALGLVYCGYVADVV